MKTKIYLATARSLNVIEGSNGTWRVKFGYKTSRYNALRWVHA
jgi:hypothetical protein